MAAIVLDDENPDQQRAGRQGQDERQGKAEGQGEVHRRAPNEERSERRDELQRSLVRDRPRKGSRGHSNLPAQTSGVLSCIESNGHIFPLPDWGAWLARRSFQRSRPFIIGR